MDAYIRVSLLLLLISMNAAFALEAKKVLHIPEKIIGGVIDIVQSHKNKPAQQTVQIQGQQQVQQGYGWNTAYQSQNQNQAQYQYANYGYPQTGQTYPQGNYVSAGQGSGYQQFGASQSQNQGQYQNYPQNPPGNQYQGQNQQSFGQQQFQTQAQNSFQGQSQTQVQNQQQNQNGQFPNQNQQTDIYFQGNHNFANQQIPQNQFTGSYGGGQQTGSVASSSNNYIGQGQPSHNYVVSSYPQGQVPQQTFVGQNLQSTQFQGPTLSQTGLGASYGGSQNFQVSNGSQPGTPGPTCVCQAWTKPLHGHSNNNPSQRNEEKSETPE